MKSVNTYYSDAINLQLFLEKHQLKDSPMLLIQVFTGVTNRDYIESMLQEIDTLLPEAKLIGCTTDGEIMDGAVSTKMTVLSFTQFEETTLQTQLLPHTTNGYYSGKGIAKALIHTDTKLIIAFSDGLNSNGEAFLEGVSTIDSSIIVAGGLAGDNAMFKQTYVFDKTTIISKGAVAVSFSNPSLQIRNRQNFNWHAIGNELLITKAEGNRLYTINHQTAYDTYAHYLGQDVAKLLPKIGIEFPLITRRNGIEVARAVIAKHDDGSLSFAGNLHKGEYVRFGHGDAEGILRDSTLLSMRMKENPSEVNFVYSCMARRHFLGQSVEQETLSLQDIAPTAGFFTYGEFFSSGSRELLNQTMTILSLSETPRDYCLLPQSKAFQDLKNNTSRRALFNLIEVTHYESKLQEKIAKEREAFELMFEKSADGILIIKEDHFIQCNQKMVKMLDYPDKSSILKLRPGAFSPEFQPDGRRSITIIQEKIARCLSDGEQSYELSYLRANGSLFWAEVILIPINLEEGRVIKAVYRDITQRKEIEYQLSHQKEILYYQARHDALTGLPNRTLFQEKFQHKIDSMAQLTLMFIDLDGFKSINDSLGHDVGDKILQLITKRLQSLMTHGHTLFRLGGDEFTIIIDNINQKSQIDTFGQQILTLLKEPVIFDDHRLDISGSIGVSFYPQNGQKSKDLLKNADVAMYKSKEQGGNTLVYYKEEMSLAAYAFIKMKTYLHDAIKNSEFEVYYQPQIDIKTEQLIGVEALIRWNHPIDGTIAPGNFLSVARETGLMVEIDWWVMKTAMQQMTEWKAQGFNPGSLALNLTIKQLEEKNFFSQLNEAITQTGFDIQTLDLELEEGEVMKNPSEIITIFEKLHAMGIKISIDDFGTGYSSLAYLKRLPIDKLKIDRSFIIDIPHNHDSTSIINAIISMAKSLKLNTVAEGVEYANQRDYLLAQGCDVIQGYFYSKPLSAQAIFEKYTTT